MIKLARALASRKYSSHQRSCVLRGPRALSKPEIPASARSPPRARRNFRLACGRRHRATARALMARIFSRRKCPSQALSQRSRLGIHGSNCSGERFALRLSRLSLVEMESVLATKVRTREIDQAAAEIERRCLRVDLVQGRLTVGPLILTRHYQVARTLLLNFGATDALRTLDAL